MTLSLTVLAFVFGCAEADPWAEMGLQDPEHVVSRAWFSIELAGHTVGLEERVVGETEGRPVTLRRRQYAFRVNGVVTERRAGGASEADPMHVDGLDFRPLDGPREVRPHIDVVEVLRRPSPPISNARRSHRGRYFFGEREIEVERPLRGEIPAATWTVLEDLVQTARSRTHGDCKEHAAEVKRAALERDLDARIVRGLVYVDGVFGPGFDPHAWTEVWMERQWFQVDAIFEQPVADATHIPVTPGDVLSRVPLRVVEVQ